MQAMLEAALDPTTNRCDALACVLPCSDDNGDEAAMMKRFEPFLDVAVLRIYYEDYAAMLADDQAVIPDYPAGGVAA